jgi:hypothetical protein
MQQEHTGGAPRVSNTFLVKNSFPYADVSVTLSWSKKLSETRKLSRPRVLYTSVQKSFPGKRAKRRRRRSPPSPGNEGKEPPLA